MPTHLAMTRIVLTTALCLGMTQGATAQPGGEGGRRERGPSVFIRGARVLTMDGPPIENATVQIAGGSIRRIGQDVRIPEGATFIDGSGMTLTPGLIDADATLGMSYATRGGSSAATNRSFDAFDRYALDLFKDAVRNGVTTVSISPRTGDGITGTSAVVRLQAGPDGPWAGVPLKEEAALCVDLNSQASPTARLDVLDRVRRQFRAALDYRDARETYKEDLEEYEKKIKERAEKEKAAGEKKPEGGEAGGGGGAGGSGGEKKEEEIKKPTEPATDRNAEVLLRAIDRQLPVRFRCVRSEDIYNALELAREFSLNAILDGATDAHLAAPEIADAKARVILGTALSPAFYQNDAFHRRSETSFDALRDAGVTCIVASGRGGGVEDGIGDSSASRFVLANAQLVAGQSNTEVDPLRLVTAEAADFLGIADRVGRLRPGMAADVVLWTGDPLDPASRVREVYIGGELVYRNESLAKGGESR